jgi:ADP-ribose pyrophosphatase
MNAAGVSEMPGQDGAEILGSKSTRFGQWLGIETRRLRLPSSLELDAHVVLFPDIVVVVGEFGSSVVLVRQFRFPPLDWIVELPAGRVEPGEDPADTARRELSEETGFDCSGVEKLGELRVSPHLSGEITHVYKALDLRAGRAHPEKGELIETMKVPRNRLRAMVAQGKIADAKSISALVLAGLL